MKRALQLLKALPLFFEKISTIYETAPLYFKTPNRFLNLVLKLRTSLSPYALFIELKKIEFQMGRRKTQNISDRPIDLDIIFYENVKIEGEVLRIPHPRAYERAFVMIPLCEIAPDFVDPLSGKKICEICEEKTSLFREQEIKAFSENKLL